MSIQSSSFPLNKKKKKEFKLGPWWLIFTFFLRCLPLAVRGADVARWHSPFLPGTGSRPGHPTGQHRSVEVHLPQASWHRLLQLCGKKRCCHIPTRVWILGWRLSIRKWQISFGFFYKCCNCSILFPVETSMLSVPRYVPLWPFTTMWFSRGVFSIWGTLSSTLYPGNNVQNRRT